MKKLVFLVSVVMVFVLAGSVVADPNLLARYTFDDSDANDSSGNNHHGTIVQGDPNTSISFVFDAERGSIVIDCKHPNDINDVFNSYIDLGGVSTGPDPHWPALLHETSTMALWVKVRTFHETTYLLSYSGRYQMRTGWYSGALQRGYIYHGDVDFPTGGNNQYQWTHNPLDDGQWHHIACTYDSVAQERKIYMDGDLSSVEPAANGLCTTATDDNLYLVGSGGAYWERGLDGLADDFQLYTRVLSHLEFKDYVGNYKAYEPVPADGAVDQPKLLPSVDWTAHPNAIDHRVYLGTSEANVVAGDASVDKGVVVGASYSGAPMGNLSLGEVSYYWRVDTNDGSSVITGNVWEFVTAPAVATDPDPWDSEMYVATSHQISWKPGEDSIKSVVYFGTDLTQVTDGNSALATVVNHPADPCVLSPALVADENYYWKVDSNTGALFTPGLVWTFSTDAISPEPNLIAYYTLDEMVGGASVTFDVSGKGHHGTVVQGDATTGVSIVSDAERGNVLFSDQPDGHFTNTLIDCGGRITDADPCWPALLNETATIETWVKVRTLRHSNYLYQYTGRYQARASNYYSPVGAPFVYQGDVDFISGTSNQYQYADKRIDDGKWHCFIMTFDSAVAKERKIYLDGNLCNTEEVGNGLCSLTSTNAPFAFSGGYEYMERGWDGWIDDMKLYTNVKPGWIIKREYLGCATCAGDLDGDGDVDLDDLNQLVGDLTMEKLATGKWEIPPTSTYWKDCSDMETDGVIDLKDLNRMVGNLTWERIFNGVWTYNCGAYFP